MKEHHYRDISPERNITYGRTVTHHDFKLRQQITDLNVRTRRPILYTTCCRTYNQYYRQQSLHDEYLLKSKDVNQYTWPRPLIILDILLEVEVCIILNLAFLVQYVWKHLAVCSVKLHHTHVCIILCKVSLL